MKNASSCLARRRGKQNKKPTPNNLCHMLNRTSQTKDAIPTEVYSYIPSQHQQHKRATLV